MIAFHIQRYKDSLNDCKNDKGTVRPAEISFATKFIATYLFFKIKGTRQGDISIFNVRYD